MSFDEVTEALLIESEHRYHTDAEFHALVDTAVQASIYHPSIRRISEGPDLIVRRLMVKSTSLCLVLREHAGNA